MTSTQTQKDLGRSHGAASSLLQRPYNTQAGVAGSLYNHTLRLLSNVARELRVKDNPPVAFLHGYVNEVERFFLWGDGFTIQEGGLDMILERSGEIRNNVMTLLYEVGVAAQSRQKL